MTITDIAAAAAMARSTICGLYKAKDPVRVCTSTHRAVLAVNVPPRRRIPRSRSGSRRTSSAEQVSS